MLESMENFSNEVSSEIEIAKVQTESWYPFYEEWFQLQMCKDRGPFYHLNWF